MPLVRRASTWLLRQRPCVGSSVPVSTISSGSFSARALQSCQAGARRQQYSSKQGPNSSAKQAKALPTFLVLGTLVGASVYYWSSPPAREKVLNDRTFVPYTITAREAISPTSFVFTVSPQHPNLALPYLASDSQLWRYPLWSVEFKQPQVQIARHYTPLPPLQHEDPTDGSLRFYIRAVGDGEMSNYLGRLGVGNDVWLRGPHTGFDLLGRLGDKKSVVFLAGGTGVVPGLQAARAVLDQDEHANVTLLWSIRKREELDAASPAQKPWWDFWSQNTPEELKFPLSTPSPVGRQFEEMRATYRERLRIHVAVSQDSARFGTDNLKNALVASVQGGQDVTTVNSSGCQLHDQKLHERASEFETPGIGCLCPPTDSCNPGKNVFVVCGPEGFVSHYAGPKVWEGGRETQGPVGGVAAQLLKQNPQLASEWLILKL
ncbi:Cytochrome c mitochondrial import factor CYC2 [Paramyrothecium foliicola]|nr:Cytochrome c mitochondrial import factor CYC2 [Paramyrothecium foliicola]